MRSGSGHRAPLTPLRPTPPPPPTLQCRERFLHHLNPTIEKGPWEPEEETLLFQLQVRSVASDLSRSLWLIPHPSPPGSRRQLMD